jgi:hypothetical protein
MPKETKARNPFKDEDLTELDKLFLETLGRRPLTVVQFAERLGIAHTFEIREALIGRLIKLEGLGLVRGEGSPKGWSLTSRGERSIS